MSVWRSLVALDLDFRGRLGVDQRLVEEADDPAEQGAAFVTLQCAEHLGQVNIVVGHRSIPFVSCMDSLRTTPVASLHDSPIDVDHFRVVDDSPLATRIYSTCSPARTDSARRVFRGAHCAPTNTLVQCWVSPSSRCWRGQNCKIRGAIAAPELSPSQRLAHTRRGTTPRYQRALNRR